MVMLIKDLGAPGLDRVDFTDYAHQIIANIPTCLIFASANSVAGTTVLVVDVSDGENTLEVFPFLPLLHSLFLLLSHCNKDGFVVILFERLNKATGQRLELIFLDYFHPVITPN